jgi:parvulin-like peptidyl-prolyl isomerase
MSQIRASHILVDTEEEAKSLKARIDGGADFAQLAAGHSNCPSSEQGGDLGFFRRGMMVKAFEDAAFALAKGQVSGPVKTEFGWHLIKLTDLR